MTKTLSRVCTQYWQAQSNMVNASHQYISAWFYSPYQFPTAAYKIVLSSYVSTGTAFGWHVQFFILQFQILLFKNWIKKKKEVKATPSGCSLLWLERQHCKGLSKDRLVCPLGYNRMKALDSCVPLWTLQKNAFTNANYICWL